MVYQNDSRVELDALRKQAAELRGPSEFGNTKKQDQEPVPVGNQLAYLEKQLMQLNETLRELEQRISPVLLESVCSVEMPDAPKQPMCEVSSRIYESVHAVNRLNVFSRQLVDAVQL